MSHPTPTFESYWGVYVGAHRHPLNRLMHYIGGGVFLTGTAAAIWTLQPLWWAGGLVLGYGLSWTGHTWIEGNRPAAWDDPLRASLAEARMLLLGVTGRMDKEVIALYGSASPSADAPLRKEVLEHRLRESRRIDDNTREHPFEDYWDVFLLKHQHPANVWMHVAGLVYLYAIWAVILWTQIPWLLLLLPGSQLLGWLGHRAFERSHVDRQDLLGSTRAFASLHRMAWRVVIGRYWSDVAARRQTLDAYLQSRPVTPPDDTMSSIDNTIEPREAP